jgi:hypothetical protein
LVESTEHDLTITAKPRSIALAMRNRPRPFAPVQLDFNIQVIY